ncbi:hypothetical protein C8A00DRAFT_38738 [Chaetomidium leptoderma]|uniref:Uncharacterized protein n=1 Tax=Chaetomidium leptoderma TaxID=669021 RepID=A0AAN6VC45_9PEZI|nr:hypothetical protein C8A00DRAFT_38738 [Chaetomidium leptoderma]
MESWHFEGWHCLNDECQCYSLGAQQYWRQKRADIIDAQKKGRALPFEQGSDNAGMQANPGMVPANVGMMEADMGMEANIGMEANNAANAAQGAQGPPYWAGWTDAQGNLRFSAQDVQNIDTLLKDIDTRIAAGGVSRKAWVDEEQDLLLLLRAHDLGYQDISTHFIPRHPANGCESERARLKKKGR